MTLTRAEQAHWQRRYRAAMREGTWQRQVPVAEIRLHIDHLRTDAGMSIRAIATAAGLPTTTVGRIALRNYGQAAGRQARYVSPTTAAALRRVHPDAAAPETYVSALPSRRRLEALHAIGWSTAAIAARLGVSDASVRQLRTYERITAGRARRFRELYDELAEWDGRSARTIDTARARGYAPPWAWTEETIHDPSALPDLTHATRPEPPPRDDVATWDDAAVDRAVSGHADGITLTREERQLAVAELAGRGWSDGEIATWLGVVPMTVLRDRQEHDIESRWTA